MMLTLLFILTITANKQGRFLLRPTEGFNAFFSLKALR